MGDVFCNNCGHRNPAGSNFCSSCGSVLETESAEPTTITFFPTQASDPSEEELAVSADDVPTEGGVLVVKRGPNAGSRFVLESDVVTVGRHPDSDIFLDDITVSRRHVEIVPTDDGFLVRDAGSLNGTYLNRQRIDSAMLSTGDELQVGKFKLFFFQGEPVEG